ncbi:MAG TPA: N-acetylmuramoyl-L-alanine amidase, partial [Methyloceanibacter sp.]|nr:N-acetylmuramoyl-L-alanine amidase [Methyloceanibacter sp.]
MRRQYALVRAVPASAVLLAILIAGVALSAADTQAHPRETVAKDARLAGDRGRTRFIADLSKKVDVSVFSLADPYRVIVD